MSYDERARKRYRKKEKEEKEIGKEVKSKAGQPQNLKLIINPERERSWSNVR